MSLFAKSILGEFRKWFKSLPVTNIPNFDNFETILLGRWCNNKNPLQLLTQYNNLKRLPIETFQEFSTKFMKVYNSIPDQVKPPPRAAQVHYVDAFKSEFSLLLRQRGSTSLNDMMNDEIELEVNLDASGNIKLQIEAEKKKEKEETLPSTSQASEEKLDLMLNTMEKLVENLSLDDKNHELQYKNNNFRRPLVPQIRQREQRIPVDHPVIPPFQKNYVAENFDESPEDIHCFNIEELQIYLTK
jgi:hypothetical protein